MAAFQSLPLTYIKGRLHWVGHSGSIRHNRSRSPSTRVLRDSLHSPTSIIPAQGLHAHPLTGCIQSIIHFTSQNQFRIIIHFTHQSSPPLLTPSLLSSSSSTGCLFVFILRLLSPFLLILFLTLALTTNHLALTRCGTCFPCNLM